MGAATNLDWLYQFFGLTLGALGLILLLWSLFWDRPRGRRRCPKCWYDMNGVPGLRCPECGRQRRHERALHRTRRRSRWAALAIVAGAMGYGVYGVPRYRSEGWIGLVPSTYLAYFAPAKADRNSMRALHGRPTLVSSSAPPTPTRDQLLTDEAWERLGDMWLWQSHAFVRRVMKSEGVDPAGILRVPTVWPLGVDIPCAGQVSPIGGLYLNIGAATAQPEWSQPQLRPYWSLPGLHAPASSVEAVLRWATPGGEVVYHHRRRLPIDVRVPAAELLARVDSAEATAEVREMLSPHVAEFDNRLELILFNRAGTERGTSVPNILTFTCEVRHGDRLLATTRYDDTPFKPNARIVWSALRVEWPDDARGTLRSGEATITIRGDYDAAMRIYTRHPFDPPERVCWTGEFTAPLPLKPHPRKR